MFLRQTVRARIANAVGALLVGMFGVVAAGTFSSIPVGASTKHSGNVDVYYAASLQQIMEGSIGPAFARATGYTFRGFSGASGTNANLIKSGAAVGDVFISANVATNLTLEGTTNGDWLRTFVVFGNSPLVLGYNPKSAFATTIKTQPWFAAVTSPGIRVGRTDPVADPKGKLTSQAVAAGVQIYNDPALAAVTASPSNVYLERSLVGLLQSGQLDAGFFYSSEARAAGIPFVKLGHLDLAATFTIGELARDAHQKAADAFMAFLLGKSGSKLLAREGVSVVRPRV
ncbi:MAG TPA: substrate-binding domain-containing protein, partial [Acidimicrobiales bacterium]|nr:substrate-binding domain-containing protein [Acidimicrobiales bacterium]